MRILVTGHDGYIGTVLVPLLVERGFEVVGLDSFLFADCGVSEQPYSIEEVCKDIRDIDISDFEGIDVVIHLAGLSNDPLGSLSPDITMEINHRAAVKTARLAKQAGVKRFIFSSTCSVYGAAGQDMVDETSDLNPVTPYAVAKLYAEQEILALGDDNFCPVALRHATAFGASPKVRFDLVVNNLVAWAISTHQVLLKSDGMPWRPLVHVDDISQAFLVSVTAPTELVHCLAVNVGRTDQNFRIKEIANAVADCVPDCALAFEPGAGADKRTYRVNCDKFEDIFGAGHLTWTMEKGVQQIYDEFKNMNLAPEDFEGMRFARLPHLQHLVAEGRADKDFRPISTYDLVNRRTG